MVTCAILDDISKIHNPDSHHTIVLYPGSENYKALDTTMSLFKCELRELVDIGLKINGIEWKFNLYFSADWKFLSICLGFNAANSLYFCPWCTISKKQIADFNQEWSISKQINKLKVLQFFDLSKILPPTRASAIRMLWNGFYDLYIAIRDPTTDPKIFKINAKMWLKIFLTPSTGNPNNNNFVQSLYKSNDVTLYIHVLVFHIYELIEKHKKWKLKAFSYAIVKNKNH